MRGATSLSLEEVSVRLGVSEEEVRRALQAGEFPGRFLSDGEYRVPIEEVERARARWELRRPLVEGELQTEVSSEVATSAPVRQVDVEGLRAALLEVLQTERKAFIDDLLIPMEKTDVRLSRLEDEIRSVRRSLQALGPGTDSQVEDDGRWQSAVEGVGLVDVRALVREIADLEAMLSDFED